MIQALKPYPVYKDSGVLWLGQVPEHWDVLPARALFAEIKDREHPDEEMLSVTITHGVIRQKTLLEGSSKKDSSNLDRSAYKLVCPDDIAYNKMRAWQGAIGLSDVRGIVSPAYVVVRLRQENEPRYFHHLFRTTQFAKEAERWSYGITSDMWSLRPEHFRMIYCALPPKGEQAAIVRFLDHADRRIRRYIRTKQKVIKLMEEEKRVIIHCAVTRGLDPNVRLRPSGVEWLGDVPEHWEIRKLRSLFRRHGSGTTPAGDMYYGGEIPWVMTGDLTDGILRATRRTVNQLALEQVSALRMYAKGSLIVAMYGATIGKTGVLEMDACTNQACCVLEGPVADMNVEYVQAVVNVARPNLVEQSYGGGQPNINSEIVRSLRVPVPTRQEQDGIVEAIRNLAEPRAINRIEREIVLVREFRSRLIADVVTGKLDVRETAAQLPEEAEDEAFTEDSEVLEEEPSAVEESVEEATI